MRKALILITFLCAAIMLVACSQEAPKTTVTNPPTGEAKKFEDPKSQDRGGAGPSTASAD